MASNSNPKQGTGEEAKKPKAPIMPPVMPRVQCTRCDLGWPAYRWCEACSEFLCFPCTEIHNKSEEYKDHKLSAELRNRTPKPPSKYLIVTDVHFSGEDTESD